MIKILFSLFFLSLFNGLLAFTPLSICNPCLIQEKKIDYNFYKIIPIKDFENSQKKIVKNFNLFSIEKKNEKEIGSTSMNISSYLKQDLLSVKLDRQNYFHASFFADTNNKNKKFGKFLLYAAGGTTVGVLTGVGIAYIGGKTEDPNNKNLAKIYGGTLGILGLFVGSMVYTIKFD